MAVDRVRFATYVMCGMFAGLTGYLVSGFSGGAALNMGAEYLLASIAVVVIGGTSVAGGFANLPGLWGAAMLLFLLVTMLNTYGFGAGIRMVSLASSSLRLLLSPAAANPRADGRMRLRAESVTGRKFGFGVKSRPRSQYVGPAIFVAEPEAAGLESARSAGQECA